MENAIVLKEIRRAHKEHLDLKASLTTYRRLFKDLKDMLSPGNTLPGLGNSLVVYFKGPDMHDIFGVRSSDKWSSAVKSQKSLSKILFQKSAKEFHAWRPRRASNNQRQSANKFQKFKK